MQLDVKRREVLKFSLAGLIGVATAGMPAVASPVGRSSQVLRRQISGPRGNNYSGILVVDLKAIKDGVAWCAGHRPFDWIGMQFETVGTGTRVRLMKFGLTSGTAAVEAMIVSRQRTVKIGFHISEDAGMQLVVGGQMLDTNDSVAAKATLAIDERWPLQTVGFDSSAASAVFFES